MVGRPSGEDVVEMAAMSTPAWASASLNAIQPSSAHLTRAGYLDDARERDAVAEDVLVAGVLTPAGQHGVDLVERRERLRDGGADDQVGEHRGRRREIEQPRASYEMS